MKLHTKLLFLGLSFLCSCAPEIYQGDISNISKFPRNISVDADNFYFDATDNRIATLNIKSLETSWEITSASEWLSINPSSGKTSAQVTILAEENNSFEKVRGAVITINSTDADYKYTKNIAITQEGKTINIQPESSSIAFGAGHSTKSVVINSNIEWEATCTEKWIVLEKLDNSSLNISCLENLGASRYATIFLSRKNETKVIATINILQDEAGITGSTTPVNFNPNGGVCELSFQTDVSWTAYTTDESWLSVSQASGFGGIFALEVSVLPNMSSNDRSGSVYVKIGETQKLSLPVKQEGIKISVSHNSLEFIADGEQKSVIVTSNVDCEIISMPEWLSTSSTIIPEGTTELNVIAAKNKSLDVRRGMLRIGKNSTNIFTDISISQQGNDVISENTLNFGWEAASATIEIVAPNEWNAMCSEDWLSLSKYSGIGAAEIAVSVATNDNESQRTATITISAEGKLYTLTVIQDGQYLNVSSVIDNVSVAGGEISIDISSSVGYEATTEPIDCQWVVIDKTETGVKLTVASNPSVNERFVDLIIKPTKNTTNVTYTSGIKIRISQNSRTLTTNVSEIMFFSAGGISDVFTIQADGDYSIKKGTEDIWYLLNHDTVTKTFFITVSEISSGMRKGEITLSLENLPDGESFEITIPVIQYDDGVSIGKTDFNEDDYDWSEL